MSLINGFIFGHRRIICTKRKFIQFVKIYQFENIANWSCSKMSMSSDSKYSWVISLVCPNGNHDPIPLPHQEALFIGRSPETRIVDPRCSRKQVKLFGDLITGDIQVTQLGSNSSVLDGSEMIKDKVYHMKHNSTLNVLAGLFPQMLNVKHLGSAENKQSAGKKHPSLNNHVPDDKNKKHNSNCETKSTNKRKSSLDDENKHASKRQRLSETENNNELNKKSDKKHESVSTEKHRSKSKEKTPKHKENGSVVKTEKPDKNKIEKASSNTADPDNQNMKSVTEKLNTLKSWAKDLKTPKKPSASTSKVTPTKTDSEPSVGNSGPAPSSRWDEYDSLYVYTSKGLEGRCKIAGFDIDGTIIETQSGKKFPTHPGDWRMKFSSQVIKKLKKHHDEGFKIVFFTNQMGVSRGKTNLSDLKTKFADVLEEIQLPIQIFVASKGGIFRKPCTGMWNFLTKKANDGVDVELSQSFYVGDAAGRPANWAPKKKKDFACSDRLFALNIGLEFKSPEEFFIGYPTAKFDLPTFDPRKVSSKTQLLDPANAKLISSDKEVIVLTGCPASGKSFFSKKYLVPKGYAYVNRDTLGSWQKCVASCKDNLKKGISVVIDNTNPELESRARYLKAALSLGVSCRCFVFNTTLEQAKHNEKFREIIDKSHQPINDIIMNSFKGKYKPPVLSEGFKEIVKVNFVPKFKNENEEKVYKMFLMG